MLYKNDHYSDISCENDVIVSYTDYNLSPQIS